MLLAAQGPAAAQSDAEKVGAIVEGAWYGQVEGLDRPDRYLEILAVEPAAGGFTATVLFGWADGPVSPAPARVTLENDSVSLAFTARTGASLRVRFDGTSAAQGTYQMGRPPERKIAYRRLTERAEFEALNGVWSATRNQQTRIFDIKRVVGNEDGVVIAIGQFGIVEDPSSIRQLVATVDGDPGQARLRWQTGATAGDLRRTKPDELSGTFSVAAAPGAKAAADPIVFHPASAAAAGKVGGAVIEVGRPFPDLQLVTIGGKRVRPADFRGKTVLVSFFQSWDVWSLDELKAFRVAKARYGDRIVILTVNYGMSGSDRVPPKPGADRSGIEAFTTPEPVAVKRLPSNWVIDANGIVIERINYMPAHTLLALLDKMVK